MNDDSLNIQPFYSWDTIPYEVQVAEPDAGVAVGDTFSLYFLCDSSAVLPPATRQSMFAGHGFPYRNETLHARTDTSAPLWIFGVLVLLVLLTTLYYRSHKLTLKNLLASLVDTRAMDRTLRESNLSSRIRYVAMGLLAVASLMLPVHMMALAKTGIGGYLLLTAGVAVAYLLRNGLMRLLAVVFDNRAAVDSYIVSNYMYHLALATVVLPLLFPLCYFPSGTEVLLYIVAGIVILEFLMRLFRGMKLFLTHSSGPYVYLFYYLCIVEIVPILVLMKWIIE